MRSRQKWHNWVGAICSGRAMYLEAVQTQQSCRGKYTRWLVPAKHSTNTYIYIYCRMRSRTSSPKKMLEGRWISVCVVHAISTHSLRLGRAHERNYLIINVWKSSHIFCLFIFFVSVRRARCTSTSLPMSRTLMSFCVCLWCGIVGIKNKCG